MNEAIAFDTHRFIKRLTACGFTELQAETLADEQVTLLNTNLATRTDIENIRADTETLRQETRANIEALKADTETLRQETRAGIEALRQETRAGIEALRQETRAGIEQAKFDLMKWMFGGLIAQGGLVVALIKLL